MTQSNREKPNKVRTLRSSAARRRRKRPSLYGFADERSLFLGSLTHAATPAAEYYSLSLLSGAILTAAILFDLRPLYILAALAAPFMAPLAGLSVAVISGTMRFFFHSLGALLTGALLVFGMGALGGLASGIWPGVSAASVTAYEGINWADVLLLAAGAIFLAVRLYRDPQENPRLASAALAYELYFPAALAGYGLGIHSPELLQNGLTAFVMRISAASLIGAAVFAVMGLRLRLRENFSMAGSIFLAAVAILLIAGGLLWTPHGISAPAALAPTAAFTQTAIPPTDTVSPAATAAVTRTLTQTAEPGGTIASTATLKPNLTGTLTLTPTLQSYMAAVRVAGSAGVYVREEPAGKVVTSVLNGTWVEVLPDPAETVLNDAVWVFIRTDNHIEGWMMKSLLDLRAITPLP